MFNVPRKNNRHPMHKRSHMLEKRSVNSNVTRSMEHGIEGLQ
jgi:hypothetical protein